MMWTRTLQFCLPGDPVGKERPRQGRNGHMYTPSKTRKYEKAVGKAALAARMAQGVIDDEPWPMHASTYFVSVYPFVSSNAGPDGDNCFKTIDGLKGILWGDDRPVAGSFPKPRISATPRVEFVITAVVTNVRPSVASELLVFEDHSWRTRVRGAAIALAESEPGTLDMDAWAELEALVDMRRASQ